MKVESANGRTACLIYCGDGEYRIRIYDKIKLGMFNDYDIKHSDLFFNINDEDAFLYEDGDEKWIDHSPSTLGIGDTVIPFQSIPVKSSCQVCGIGSDTVMGYVCNNPQCPTRISC